MRISVVVTGAIIAGSLMMSPTLALANVQAGDLHRSSSGAGSELAPSSMASAHFTGGGYYQPPTRNPGDRQPPVTTPGDRQPPVVDHHPPTSRVPEPSTLLMVGGGLLLALKLRRKQTVKGIETSTL